MPLLVPPNRGMVLAILLSTVLTHPGEQQGLGLYHGVTAPWYPAVEVMETVRVLSLKYTQLEKHKTKWQE